MSETLVKILVVMTKKETEDFLAKKRLKGVDTMPHIDMKVKETIRKYISENIGYDDLPIAGLSKHNGVPSELRVVGASLNEYIPLDPKGAGAVLYELHVPRDLVVSIAYDKLLEYSNLIAATEDDFIKDLYLEEFYDLLQLGYVEDGADEMISFLPFIDMNRCKFFASLTPSWDIDDVNIPGAERVKLNTMNLF